MLFLFFLFYLDHENYHVTGTPLFHLLFSRTRSLLLDNLTLIKIRSFLQCVPHNDFENLLPAFLTHTCCHIFSDMLQSHQLSILSFSFSYHSPQSTLREPYPFFVVVKRGRNVIFMSLSHNFITLWTSRMSSCVSLPGGPNRKSIRFIGKHLKLMAGGTWFAILITNCKMAPLRRFIESMRIISLPLPTSLNNSLHFTFGSGTCCDIVSAWRGTLNGRMWCEQTQLMDSVEVPGGAGSSGGLVPMRYLDRDSKMCALYLL